MRDRDARIAGILYIVAIVAGVFDLRILPDRFAVIGDPASTARNIVAHEFLFRVGIAADLVVGVIWLFVVLALYQLLKDVDRIQAGLMIVLGAFMQVPLYFVTASYRAAALSIASDVTLWSAFSQAQRDALMTLFLRLHSYEIQASFLFAGLWLAPFGILVYKSKVFPRTIGVWLVANGAAYVAICLLDFLNPHIADIASTFASPLLFAEIAIALWLTVFGTKTFGRRR
ncbi:MAG: DUF4386 domain-containing protein [Candidatus Tumulicola sp.]